MKYYIILLILVLIYFAYNQKEHFDGSLTKEDKDYMFACNSQNSEYTFDKNNPCKPCLDGHYVFDNLCKKLTPKQEQKLALCNSQNKTYDVFSDSCKDCDKKVKFNYCQ